MNVALQVAVDPAQRFRHRPLAHLVAPAAFFREHRAGLVVRTRSNDTRRSRRGDPVAQPLHAFDGKPQRWFQQHQPSSRSQRPHGAGHPVLEGKARLFFHPFIDGETAHDQIDPLRRFVGARVGGNGLNPRARPQTVSGGKNRARQIDALGRDIHHLQVYRRIGKPQRQFMQRRQSGRPGTRAEIDDPHLGLIGHPRTPPLHFLQHQPRARIGPRKKEQAVRGERLFARRITGERRIATGGEGVAERPGRGGEAFDGEARMADPGHLHRVLNPRALEFRRIVRATWHIPRNGFPAPR